MYFGCLSVVCILVPCKHKVFSPLIILKLQRGIIIFLKPIAESLSLLLITFPAMAASPRRPYGDADADADVHIDGVTDDVDAWDWDPHLDDVSDIVVECCCHLGYMLFGLQHNTKKLLKI
jgi:hypothetical protein